MSTKAALLRQFQTVVLRADPNPSATSTFRHLLSDDVWQRVSRETPRLDGTLTYAAASGRIAAAGEDLDYVFVVGNKMEYDTFLEMVQRRCSPWPVWIHDDVMLDDMMTALYNVMTAHPLRVMPTAAIMFAASSTPKFRDEVCVKLLPWTSKMYGCTSRGLWRIK